MGKRELKPATALRPVPVVMVSCAGSDGKSNIITLAWVGVACSAPPMLTIAVRPSRYSHQLIKESKEFVVNVPSQKLARATEYCGTRSGRDGDKFAAAGLTPREASKVKAPLIAECPVNMECVVRHELALGSHELFVGEVVAVHADEEVLDAAGRIDTAKVAPMAYAPPMEYWTLGANITAEARGA